MRSFFARDTDASFANGYQGQVKFQSGGAIVPRGGLTRQLRRRRRRHHASGGGSNPAARTRKGPPLNDGPGALITDGQDHGGAAFHRLLADHGRPGGWRRHAQQRDLRRRLVYDTIKFSMTSGTSGVYVEPHCP